MDLLRKLELKAQEIWSKAMKARGLDERQRLLKLHRETYEQYKRHKQWIKAIEQ